jgi:alpha-L-fucosidase
LNLLLNIGPDDRGRVPEKQAEILRELAAWMEHNGEAIHKTRGIGHYRTVRKDGKATYRFVFSWDEPVTVTGIEHSVETVRALDPAIELEEVDVRREGETWTVKVSKPENPDPHVTVIGIYEQIPEED